VFHERFASDPSRWSLANQMDFFVFRAEQERRIRQASTNGVHDGGLDQDFHVFTRHLYETGRLVRDEYDLCHRTYRLIRQVLPPPDVIIRVSASLPVLVRRRMARGRSTDESIISAGQLSAFERLLDKWTGQIDQAPVIHVDALDGFEFSPNVKSLAATIQEYLDG
jgi:deoxyguanosine kinase